MTEPSLEEKKLHQETELYEDGTPSPYVKIICEDYCSDLCWNDCEFRGIGCAGDHKHGKKSVTVSLKCQK